MGKKIKPAFDRITQAEIENFNSEDDYLYRLKKIATSMFEWVNLPSSMSARYLEECLFGDGKATLLKDKTKGFINTRCADDGTLNIYNIPNRFNCYSFNYSEERLLFTGLKNENFNEDNQCILVMNNYDRIPTVCSIELFAKRLANADRTCDINLNAQKTPVLIAVDDTQRLTMENVYKEYSGNQPVIFGDKNQINSNYIKAIKTDAPYIIDKVTDYKKEIWNECLTFLGISNMAVEKKERLVTDEANSNNELVNLNLQSFLVPRQKACEEFNKLFGFIGTDKEISVRVRSDLYNIIKKEMSTIQDFNNNGIDDRKEGNINE